MSLPYLDRLIRRILRARSGADVAFASALLLLAIALRVPYLYLVPTWTDEVGESSVALQITRGVLSPFTVMAGYTGPAQPDLVALVLKFFENPYAPRAVNLVLASLTVPATYFFGRSLYNRATGIIAALLLATSSTHIVVNSHLAYASAATPLFTTLACLFLVLADKFKNAWLLGLAGVSLTLAMQTHPVAVAIAPGLLLWFFLRPNARQWFRRPGLYLAGLATLATYAPVLYPIINDPENFRQSLGTRTYAIETQHSLLSYLGNVQNLLVEVLRMVGAHYSEASRPLAYLTDPLVLGYALLLPLGITVLLRRGWTLPIFALVSPTLIIPYFNHQYVAFPYFTRYVALLLPIIYVVIASLIVEVWNWFSKSARFHSRARQLGGAIAAMLFVAALIVFPAQRTFQYYTQQMKAGASNESFLEIIRRVDAAQDATVLVDDSLKAGEFPSGGNLYRTFRIWFRFENRPFARVNVTNNVGANLCTNERAFLIATTLVVAAPAVDCPMVRLLEYKIPTRPGRDALQYGLYEIGAAP